MPPGTPGFWLLEEVIWRMAHEDHASAQAVLLEMNREMDTNVRTAYFVMDACLKQWVWPLDGLDAAGRGRQLRGLGILKEKGYTVENFCKALAMREYEGDRRLRW